MMDNVKIIRLVTGDILIGEHSYTDITKTHKLNKVAAVGANLHPQTNNIQMTMQPYFVYSKDEDYQFQSDHVLHVSNPHEDLLRHYLQAKSGLTLPPTSGIIKQ